MHEKNNKFNVLGQTITQNVKILMTEATEASTIPIIDSVAFFDCIYRARRNEFLNLVLFQVVFGG